MGNKTKYMKYLYLGVNMITLVFSVSLFALSELNSHILMLYFVTAVI